MGNQNQRRRVLTLIGHVPAKKNRWHRSTGGAIYFDQKGIQQQIDSLVLQARSQWGGGTPASQPTIIATLYVSDRRGDLDNKWTTVQDCLVSAGVLAGDSLKHLPGPIGFRGEVDPNERTVIEILEVSRG